MLQSLERRQERAKDSPDQQTNGRVVVSLYIPVPACVGPLVKDVPP
jgi:hypothetical protein